MISIYKKLLLLSLSVALSGCLITRGQLKDREEKQELEQRVETLQASKAQAEMANDEAAEQMRSMNGRIEILEQKILRAEEDKQKALEDKAKAQDDAGMKLKLFQEVLEQQEKTIKSLNERITALESRKTSSAKPKAKKGNFTGAEENFGKKDWAKAILGYQKYRDLNPKGKKYAEATYKIGVCFQELGQAEQAKAFYQEVIDKYPKTNSMAKKANYRLSRLK